MENKIKTPIEVLKSFIKRNKQNRETFAINAGFSNADYLEKHLRASAEKYKLDNLDSNKKKNSTASNIKNKDVIIHNVHIIDASGSMESSNKLKNALKGINEEVLEMKKDIDTKYLQTIVSFSNRNDIQTHQFKTPINLVPKLGFNTRGVTALYEAIHKTLSKIKKEIKSGEKTIVKIFTDGGENGSSYMYSNGASCKTLIEKLTKKDVTVTFVGTKTDVKSVTNILKLDETNVLTHNNTSKGVSRSFELSNVATKNYVTKVKKGEEVLTGFYKGMN